MGHKMKLDIDHLTEPELIELNHKIVERLRLMRQIRSHNEMFKFKIGDRVRLHPSVHEPQTGTLTRFNRKSVTVITDNGGHWNVEPTLIELAEPKDSGAATEMPQLKLLK